MMEIWGQLTLQRGSRLTSWMVLTIVHIAEIEPPKTNEIPRLMAMATIVAVMELEPAEFRAAAVAGLI
jgi:hypothetical protein